MGSKPSEAENEDENSITEEREELMIPPNSDGSSTLRTAHFLKPLLNPPKQPLPKTPLSFFSSNPNIKEVEKKVFFKGRLRPQISWDDWVKDLQQTHKNLWKNVGIFDAIKTSTYNIRRDNELIICLAEKWCPETNSFVFSWGESTITLEDIMILGGYSVLGDSVHTLSQSKKSANTEVEGKLVKSCSVIRRKYNNLVTHYGWMNYFKGKGGELEHSAFLVLWLSRYVLPTSPYITVSKNNFSIAISLAMGTKLALAPAILASIYRDLTTLKQKLVVFDSSELVLWASFQLVQLWAWERFSTLSPPRACLSHGEPRMARWHNVSKISNPNLRSDIESAADGFIWRPYVLCLNNWEIPKFYYNDGMWAVVSSDDDELLSFVRCLRGCELVGLDCLMQYLPHRVAMQFGLDQDIPNYVPRLNDDYDLAWSSYDQSIEGLKVYLPPRLFEGDVTMEYLRWWRSISMLDMLDDERLITYARRGRSARKRKRKSISKFCPENEVHVENLVASSSMMINGKSLSCEGFEPRNHENELVVGLPSDENDLENGNGILSEDLLLMISPKRNALFGFGVEDEEHKYEEDEDTKRMKTSIEDIVVVIGDDDEQDEEENSVFKQFEPLCLDFETRIDKLEKIVYALKEFKKNKAMI